MRAIKAGLVAWAGLVLLFLYLPLFVLVAYSFNESRLNVVWQGFTWRWYAALAGDAVLLRALRTSLFVAVATAALSTILGTSAAWVLHRHRFPGERLIRTLAFLPMIAPEVILGVSLLVLFVAVHLELGYATVVISHVTFCVPFVMVVVQARLAGLDPALEEAALDLGATPVAAFRKVLLPYLAPAVAAGMLMAFMLSLDELVVTYFTASAGSRTLPLEIYGRVKKGLDPSLNAISTLFVLSAIALAIAGDLLGRGRARPRARARALVCAALALLSAVASSCTKGDPPRELNLFAWSEYVPQSVIDGFTRETGIRVNYESYASNEEMLAKLLSGATRYDLIQPSEYVVEALIQSKRLQPLDFSKIPNLRNVAPELLHLPHDPEQRYSVPWMSGTVGIVVDTAKIPAGEVRGYADVFQEKHRGRIVVVDDPREMVSWALAARGIPPNEVTPANLAQAEEQLAKWLPLVKVYDSDSPKTALLNGDVDLGVVWSGEAALLHREDPRFQYVLPAEGAHRFVDNLAVPADARDPDAAFRFIDYVLRPDVSREISAEFPYTNPNLAARKLLSPEELANPASYPKDDVKLDTFRDIGEAAVPIDKLVARVKERR